MFNKSLKKPSVRDIGNVPNAAYEQAKQEWSERMGEPVVEKNRLVRSRPGDWTGLSGLDDHEFHDVAVKTVEPYVINVVNKDTGEASGSVGSGNSNTSQLSLRKNTSAKWIEQLITIDPGITNTTYDRRFVLTRGKSHSGIHRLQGIKRSRCAGCVRKDPDATSPILSVAFVKDNIANVRFVAEERQAATTLLSKRRRRNYSFRGRAAGNRKRHHFQSGWSVYYALCHYRGNHLKIAPAFIALTIGCCALPALAETTAIPSAVGYTTGRFNFGDANNTYGAGAHQIGNGHYLSSG